MNQIDYEPPASQLLSIGQSCLGDSWIDYPEIYVLSLEHVPDLIRMATDEELNFADSESPEVWAPVHAWRALGQLQADDSIDSLILQLDDDDENDWLCDDFPFVCGLIGTSVIERLRSFLSDNKRGLHSRIAVAHGLERIAAIHPESYPDCVSILANQLQRMWENGPDLNGFLIIHLLELEAEETAPLIEKAFLTDSVDESIVDWRSVQSDFNFPSLKQDRFPRSEFALDFVVCGVFGPNSQQRKTERKRKKLKRKLTNKSRKLNRKRK